MSSLDGPRGGGNVAATKDGGLKDSQGLRVGNKQGSCDRHRRGLSPLLPLSPRRHSRHDHSLSMPYRPCPSTKLHLSVRPARFRAKIIPSLKPIAPPPRPGRQWALEMQSISLGCDRTPCHEGWDRLSPIPFVDEVSLSSLHCLFFDFPSRGLQDNQALTAISFALFFGPSSQRINQPVFFCRPFRERMGSFVEQHSPMSVSLSFSLTSGVSAPPTMVTPSDWLVLGISTWETSPSSTGSRVMPARKEEVRDHM